jgi:hypothetical protein
MHTPQISADTRVGIDDAVSFIGSEGSVYRLSMHALRTTGRNASSIYGYICTVKHNTTNGNTYSSAIYYNSQQ